MGPACDIFMITLCAGLLYSPRRNVWPTRLEGGAKPAVNSEKPLRGFFVRVEWPTVPDAVAAFFHDAPRAGIVTNAGA